jgi:D-beta-D-heptose 7-phosphate kinase/D-beta-D-heptose 1-phosphate adenosyltransferase
VTGDAPLVVIGDALLDRDVEGAVERLAPDAPVPVLDEQHVRSRPGGAALAAALAAAEGRPVTLVAALAGDDAGVELAALIAAAGVELVDLGLDGPTPEKVRLRTAAGQPLLRLDRGGRERAAVGRATAAARAAIGWASALLVADYGRGVAAEPGIRAALAERAAAAADDRVPIAWDPHPRGPTPTPGVLLATPNEREAATFAPDVAGDGLRALVERAAGLRRRWGARHVCITRGPRGALLDGGDGPPLAVPAPSLGAGADPCGAGDRFAAKAAALLADGARCDEAVTGAVEAASRFVAAGGASSLRLPRGAAAGAGFAASPAAAATTAAPAAPDLAHAEAVLAAARARGGTTVATGGCFDLLHAGHVRTLEAARALGDCLVVCLNDDASVRRLKGPRRPLVPARDRAAVLAALTCVDAVVVFGEDTPTALLERLRPDVWAKGGDYAGAALPEADALARWNGRAVVLPHYAGHSTTKLIEEAATVQRAELGQNAGDGGPQTVSNPDVVAENAAPPRPLGRVLVTGGSSGLGAAIVEAVAARLGEPIVLDRQPPRDPIHGVEFEQVDLADARAAEQAVVRAIERHGGLEAVVTAAGTDACGKIDDVPGEDWDRVVKVNLLGAAAVVRAALPALERADNGRVVTVASTLGLRVVSDATAYCASKFGIVGFSRALALELAGRVGVTMLVPGGMRTHFFDGRDQAYQPPPDAPLAPPEEVAAAVLFALDRPRGIELRELVVCPSEETSWP